MSRFLHIEGIPDFASRYYSLIAKRVRILRNLHREIAEEVTTRISSGRILDIGTGPGYLPLQIAKRTKTLEIVGVDIAPAMVRLAARNAELAGVSNRVKFQLGDAADLPFDDDYFDFIVSSLSLHHWSTPRKCLKEASRVLRSNGEAWIYDLRRDITKEGKSEARRRYGWFASTFLLRFIRAHSSVTLREVRELLSSPRLGFSRKSVDDGSIILKLCLLK